MKEFKISDRLTAICEKVKTRNTHYADLYLDNEKVSRGRYTWVNRTWESYTFQSAIQDAIRKAKLDKKMEAEALKWTDEYKEDNPFKAMAMVMKMGEVLAGDSQKAKNDWKLRMAKAGMGEGMIMPEDWDTLTEDEKERRLNKVIDFNLKP